MTSPLVLIAIPTFNRSHTIISTIKSICEQTYKNWELVVLDNCSNDKTEQLIRKNFSNEKRINYIYYKDFSVDSSALKPSLNSYSNEF